MGLGLWSCAELAGGIFKLGVIRNLDEVTTVWTHGGFQTLGALLGSLLGSRLGKVPYSKDQGIVVNIAKIRVSW